MKPRTLRSGRPGLPPAWVARWDAAREQAARHLDALSPRERRLLRGLTAAVAAAALFVIGLRPAWRDIARWQEELPQLRAQAAAVDALAQEAQALKREQGGRIPENAMQDGLRASLARAALGGSQRVDALEDGAGWRVAFDGASPAALFDWLAHAPGRLHLRVVQVRIDRPRDSLGRPVPARASGAVQLRNADAAANRGRP